MYVDRRYFYVSRGLAAFTMQAHTRWKVDIVSNASTTGKHAELKDRSSHALQASPDNASCESCSKYFNFEGDLMKQYSIIGD
jgi:hypothetical protein